MKFCPVLLCSERRPWGIAKACAVMAHCHNCGEEMQGGMKFCPHCGQDQAVVIPQEQRIPTEDVEGVLPPPSSLNQQQGTPQQGSGMSRTWKVGLLGCGGIGLLLLALIVVAIVSGAPDNTAKSGSGQDEGEGEKKSAPKSKGGSDSVTVAVGETAELDDRTLTVAEVESNYAANSRFSRVESGNQNLRVWVTLTNTSNRSISYNPFDFQVQDSNGVQTRISPMPETPNELRSGELAPEGRVEGNLVFEVPENDNNLSLIYTTNAFSGETITVRPLQ